jgi:hypothetical protein
MKNVIPDSPEERKELLLATLVNPELYFWIGLVLFGTAAAGWFLIGVGVLFALIPLLGMAAFWILKQRKNNKSDQPNQEQI